jgi:hypothetical protein
MRKDRKILVDKIINVFGRVIPPVLLILGLYSVGYGVIHWQTHWINAWIGVCAAWLAIYCIMHPDDLRIEEETGDD